MSNLPLNTKPSHRALLLCRPPIDLACLTIGALLALLAAAGDVQAQTYSPAPPRANAISAGVAATSAAAAAQNAPALSCMGAPTAAADAAPANVNRLRVGTVMQFDARTRSVGDAMNSLLGPVRYRVTTRTVDPALSAALMRRPLPVAARDAGYMTIEQGLLMLIGEENRLVVDHRSRLVAIERNPDDSDTAVR